MDDIPNADSVSVEFKINNSRVSEIYYSKNPKIGESKCTRQDDL